MLDYSKWRFRRHKAKGTFIDLKKQSLEKETYDCAIAIEVLEHVMDPVDTMDNIRLSLKKMGYVFVTTPFYKDPERPQHLIHDIKIAEEFKKLGFEEISASEDGLYRILKRIK